MRGLDRVLNLIPRPEKAPEQTPKPKWLGPEPVGPPDEVRSRIQERQKVQPINQNDFIAEARKQISEYVNAQIIPEIFERVEERLSMTTEDKQTLDTAIGELKTFSETYRATRVRVADLEKQLADANARFSVIQARAEKDRADLEDHKSKLAAVKAAFQD